MRGRCTLFLTLFLSTLPALAFGQAETPQLDISHARYDATGTGLSVLSSPSTLGMLRGTGGFTLHLSDEPFIIYSQQDGELTRLGGVIQSQFMLDLHGAIGFGFLDIGVVLPVAPVMVWGGDPTDGDFPVQENDAGAVGDLTFVPKVRLLDPARKGFGLGIQVPVSVPTGQKARYLGDAGVNLSVDLLVEARVKWFRALFNVSPLHIRPKVEYGDFVRQVGMDWAAGVAVRPMDMLEFRGEVWGSYAYMGGVENRFTGEWSASLAMTPSEVVSLELGAGGGIAGFGVPKLRVFAGVRFTSPERGDKDGDNIVDSKDECPAAAEDFDSWDDTDGCPDPDNDGDGIPDPDDACPDNAENPGVGYDDDGCPDVVEPEPEPEPEPDSSEDGTEGEEGASAPESGETDEPESETEEPPESGDGETP